MANYFDQFDAPAGPAPKAGGSNFFDQFDEPTVPEEKPFLEKLGNFARKVYENPPPSIAAARDVIKGAPAAATELTWGADPQAAEQAAGTIAGAAGMGLGFRGAGGTGVAARPIAKPGTVPMPSMGALFPREAAPVSAASQQAIEAAARGGYTLPRYAASEGTVIPQVAASAKNVPWAGQPIVRTHDELLANMGRAAGEIAPGAGTAETAGQAAKAGLTDYIKTSSKGDVREAYQAVDALIDPEVRVPLDNTRAAVAELMAKRTNARIPGRSKAVDLVFDAVQDPRGMNYTGTKDIRSYLGEKTNFQLAAEGIDPAEKKLLYGALSKDLAKTVTQAGGPEAFAAWRKANTLAQMAKIDQKRLAKIVGAGGDAGPEAVFNKLVTFANSKAGGDVGRLRLARRAMGPEAWSEIAPVLIDRLGRAAPGEDFSPARFVTAWNKMSGAAKSELFSGQQAAALSDLFIVSNHIQDRITRFGNPSGTARGSMIGQGITGGALFAEPVSTIATLIGTRLAAEALSRPAVVRTATSAARTSLSGNPIATRRALETLRTVVQTEGLLPQQGAERIPGRQAGGPVAAGRPYWVGEQGPEVIVPDRPGTVLPANDPSREEISRYLRATTQDYPKFGPGGIPVNPEAFASAVQDWPESTNIEDRRDERGGFAAAAQRTARGVKPPGGRQEGAGTKFVEGGYAVPSLYKMLDEGAQKAFESGGKLQHYGNEYYDPAPVVAQAIGAAGAPLVAPAMEGAVLGAGAIRRAAIPQAGKQALKEAPYPQYATEYPPTAPPELKTDPKSGKQYLGKVASPEAEEFMKTREGIIKDMKQGYEPYYDPTQRTLVDPANYPGRNVDTLTIQPAMQKTIDKYMQDIGAPITRERLRAAYTRGQELGNANDWYFMGQLEKDFVKELGEKEGRKQFLERFASGMASTTSGNNPTTNLLMSQYLNFLKERGLPMPTAGHQLPSPVGGRYGMSNVEDFVRMQEAGGYAGLGADQPKMHNFARSFVGDLDRAVMDDQMAKGMLGHSADPNMADRARKQAFGLLEAPLHAEAAAAGVRPGAYQDVAWAGFKGEPGKPMISHINDAIERTARLTGMSREEIVRRGLVRNEIPIYGFSAPMPGGDRRE